MVVLNIAGLPWVARSPSFLELKDRATVSLAFDGVCWRVAYDLEDGPARFESREAAAGFVADGVRRYL